MKKIKPATLVAFIAAIVAAVVVTLVWPKKADAPQEPGPNGGATVNHVILISVDTLRADRLSCYGYSNHQTPAFDRLASEGILFERCFTPNPITLPAHTTMLSGTSPVFHQVRDNTYSVVPSEGFATIPEVMSQAGYTTAGFVSSIVMESDSGISRGFDHYDDSLPNPAAGSGLLMPERNAEQTLAAAREWIASQPAGKPLFVFIHLFDPHFPYSPPDPSFTSDLSPPKNLSGPELSPHYDAEVRYADAQLGLFFDWLESRNIWKDSTILLTSDHGEGLGEHSELTHGWFIYDPMCHVPLIVKLPGGKLAGKRFGTISTLMDVMPTLLEAANLQFSESIKSQQQGYSLLPVARGETTGNGRTAYLESHYGYNNAGWARLRGLRTEGGLAVIHSTAPEYYSGDGPQLTNLVEDMTTAPAEVRQAYSEARDRIQTVLQQWYLAEIRTGARDRSAGSGYYHEQPSPYPGETAGAPYPGESTAGQVTRVESLGDDEGRPSPHSRSEVLLQYQTAELNYSRGQLDSTIRSIDAVLESEPSLLPALKLGARAANDQCRAFRRNLSESRDWLRRAVVYARRGADAAAKSGLTEADLDMRASAALWSIMLGNAGEVRSLANDVLNTREADLSDAAHDRWQRLLHMAAYRLAGDDTAARVTVGSRLRSALRKPRPDDDLIKLMTSGSELLLAPWELTDSR